MSKLTIYGDSISGNCLKAKWVATRLAIPFDWIETSVVEAATRTPQFLALNPWGQVPLAVLADGRTLSQSNAIMLHLAEGSDLIPADAYARAKMFEWLFWEQYSHEPVIAVRRFRVKFQKLRDQEIDASLLPKGNAVLARMEEALADSAYFVGDALTLADIALVAYTRWAGEGGFDLSNFPRVQTWIARVERDLGLPPT
ncbi:MAG: glutathione S-transferase family protein [Alphaproteobacteria bacterium]|nr:glutathione S-transferase family protein [Alphaproteobacteria bacterium]